MIRARRAVLALALTAATTGAAPPDDHKLHKGMTPEQVRALLGPPQRIARQVIYQRHLEQWLYSHPRALRLEFDCPRGREAQLVTVSSLQPNR